MKTPDTFDILAYSNLKTFKIPRIFKIQFTQNLGIFTTLVHLSPSILRAQGRLRNLSNMHAVLFSTEPCVALLYSELEAYSEPCQIFIMENFIHSLVQSQYIQSRGIFRIQGIFRILPNIYQKRFYSKPCVTLIYSELWYIPKLKHIQNPAEYVTCGIF